MSESMQDKVGRLGFVGHAREAFDFLTRLGFVETTCTNTMVDWQGARTGITVFHGSQSYIMGAEFRRLAARHVPIDLADALRAIHPDQVHLAAYQTSSASNVRAGLDQLASLVRDDCEALLAGDPQVWQRVEEAWRQQQELYEREARIRVLRERANQAWHTKEYATAVSLYREMEEALTEVEKGRVAYLTRRLGSPDE